MKSLTGKALKHANNVLLWLWISAVFRECNSTAELTLNGCGVVQYKQTARHQNCNWKNVRCSTILQYFFKSRSWRHFYAVIRERLAENCRGRTTTIICTRRNAPKYILESHRLHFGSICDQNGRNFEPCKAVVHWQVTWYRVHNRMRYICDNERDIA